MLAQRFSCRLFASDGCGLPGSHGHAGLSLLTSTITLMAPPVSFSGVCLDASLALRACVSARERMSP